MKIEFLEFFSFALALALIPANIAVWVGVYWENEKFPKEKQDSGWRLLLRGLAAETAISILSFFIDGRISEYQKRELLDMQIKENNLSIELQEEKRRTIQASLELEKMKAPRSIDQRTRGLLERFLV